MALTKYEQCERAMMLAREYKVDANKDGPFMRWFVGRQVYHDPISVTIAIIVAFDKAGIPVPKEIRERPSDL